MAGFLPGQSAVIGGTEVTAQRSFILGEEGTELDIVNTSADPLDVLLFGGKPLSEPVASRGPFVMNTEDELNDAFREFRAGNYGKITYPSEAA